jgi:hypothetical protein
VVLGVDVVLVVVIDVVVVVVAVLRIGVVELVVFDKYLVSRNGHCMFAFSLHSVAVAVGTPSRIEKKLGSGRRQAGTRSRVIIGLAPRDPIGSQRGLEVGSRMVERFDDEAWHERLATGVPGPGAYSILIPMRTIT